MSEEQSQLSKVEPVQSFGAKMIEPRLSELAKVLPSEDATRHFARIVITALNKNPKIAKCSPESILSCVFDLAVLRLEPNTPRQHAFLIPYWNKDWEPPCYQLQIQIGFRGFAELLMRSGNVKVIKSGVVRDGDKFECEDGLGADVKPFFRYRKAAGRGRSERGIIEAFCAIEQTNGSISLEVTDYDDLMNIKKLALRNGDKPSWKYFEEEMLRKIPVKRIVKLLQLENMDMVAKAIEIDNKASDIVPINGIDKPAPAEHKLVLTDECMVGETVIEPDPEKTQQEQQQEEYERVW